MRLLISLEERLFLFYAGSPLGAAKTVSVRGIDGTLSHCCRTFFAPSNALRMTLGLKAVNPNTKPGVLCLTE
jgi:hypothetical protein